MDIAVQSLVLSVRGTCFFVLGLISSTPQGAEILDDYHWEATLSPLGLPTGLCVPIDIDQFVSVSVDDVRVHATLRFPLQYLGYKQKPRACLIQYQPPEYYSQGHTRPNSRYGPSITDLFPTAATVVSPKPNPVLCSGKSANSQL